MTDLAIGVGGFQDMGAEDVIVPFGDVNLRKEDNKWWLTIEA